MRSTAATLVALAGLLWPTPSRSDDVPQRVSLQAALATASGTPASGTYTLTVRLYADSSGGAALLEQQFANTAVAGGLVDLTLDPVPQPLLDAHGVLWAEVQVNGEAPLPRRPVLPTVYALRSRSADTAAVAKGLSCSGCVTGAQAGFPWAAGVTAGGPATGLSCTGCIGTTQLASGAVGAAQVQAGAIGPTQVSFSYAASDAKGGPATDVKCVECVGAPEVSFPWAAAATPGGAAAGLACTGCVGTTELASGSVGTGQLKAGAVGDAQLGVNYAGSTSKGGPATDVACSQCVQSGDLAQSLTLSGSITTAGALTACTGSLPGCSLNVGDVMLARSSDQFLNVLTAQGVRIRSAADDAWKDLHANKGWFYGGLAVQGASSLGPVTVGGTLDLGGNLLLMPRIHNAASPPASCGGSTAGLLYFNTTSGKLFFCNGAEWVGLGTVPPGSTTNPAKSCAHIKQENPTAASGVYWLQPDGVSSAFQNYCDMSADGGGWTLVMKLNGNTTTFSYDAALWTNTATYAPQNFDFDGNEAKLLSFSSVPMDQVRLGMTVGGTTKWVQLDQSANSLYDLLKSGGYTQTSLGRNTWKSLVDNASLQPYCNREGFNAVCGGDTRIRIGMLNNQENDCDSCDSRIGFGGYGSYCGQDASNSCGNTATCSSDNGDRNTKGFGYVFVRRAVVSAGAPGSAENPAASCKAIKQTTPGVLSGVYWLSPGGGSAFQAYCEMVADGGGWTLLMKVDGNQGTFTYDSANWTSTGTVNPSSPGFDLTEAKLASFSTLPFTELRLGMRDGATTKWITVSKTAASLRDVMVGGYQSTSLGRNTWKSLINGSSLQANCNMEGFNAVCGGDTRVRIGIVNNQEGDCNSCDSRLGFGGTGTYCGQDGGNSCGNTATCSPDNGDKSIRAFGYVMAR
ncbi:MAG: hypothetical protein AMXMBFR64_03470 [Myxococcales bacterium]